MWAFWVLAGMALNIAAGGVSRWLDGLGQAALHRAVAAENEAEARLIEAEAMARMTAPAAVEVSHG